MSELNPRCLQCYKLLTLTPLYSSYSPEKYCHCSPKQSESKKLSETITQRNLTTEAESQTDFSNNIVINTEPEPERCPIHSKKIKYICWTDQQKICNECVALGNHRDPSSHELKPVGLLKEMIDPKVHCLEELLPKIEAFWDKTKKLLEEQKTSTLSMVQSRFNDMRFILNAKEAEFRYEIDSFYHKEMKRLQSHIGEDSFARHFLTEKIVEYQGIMQSPKPFELLEENLSGAFSTIQKGLNLEKLDQMGEILQQMKSSIDSRLGAQVTA